MKRALLVLPLLLLPACGGDDGGGSGGSGAGDAKAAYVAEATAVCQKAKDASAGLTTPTTAEAIRPFVDASLAVATTAQGELAALTPPPADAAQLRSKVLDPFAAAVEQGRAYAAQVAAAGSDSAKLLPLLSQRPSTDGIDVAYLRSYGLGVCADAIEAAG